MRGDRPKPAYAAIASYVFTPHARGSTAKMGIQGAGVGVYPACAGIDRNGSFSVTGKGCLPRMRGDRPAFVFREMLAK